MSERGSGISRRQALRITAVTGVATAFGGGLGLALMRQAGLRRVRETRAHLGTLVTITVVHPSAPEARDMIARAFHEMDRLDAIFSRHRTDSALGRLNEQGVLDDPPPELSHLLRDALGVSVSSDGAFDVTALPLVRLYEESFSMGRRAPDAGEVEMARARTDHASLEVHDDRITLHRPDMAVTLDGMAKGFIVDRTVDVLVRAGADRVLLDAGGDMASAGPGSVGDPWTVGLQDPHDEAGVVGLVRLGGTCIATSADHVQTYTHDRTLHHIIDPRTGRSPTETSSVSVIAESAALADALSTAALVLGPVDGIALLESTPRVEGLLVTKAGTRIPTSGMHRHAE